MFPFLRLNCTLILYYQKRAMAVIAAIDARAIGNPQPQPHTNIPGPSDRTPSKG